MRASGTSGVTLSSVSFIGRLYEETALAVPSYNLLKHSLGFSDFDIQLLSVIVLENGFKIWLDFKNSTYQEHGLLSGNTLGNGERLLEASGVG